MKKSATEKTPPVVVSEEERPLQSSAMTNELPAKSVDEYERELRKADNEHRWELKSKSFILALICIVGLFVIYILDPIFLRFFGSTSPKTSEILDILKTVIPLVLGYLFATETVAK